MVLTHNSNRTLRTITLFVFVATLLSYILLLTKNYYWDGIFFAQVIEDAPRINATLIHPSHLIDQVLGFLVYRATRLCGLRIRAVTVLQVSNCFFGAAAAAVFFRVCVDCFKSQYVSLVSTAVFAFSAVWWRFATDSNAYVLTVLVLLVTFWLLLPEHKSRPVLAGVMHALAMLLHQLAVFFFPVAIAAIVLQARRKGNTAKSVVWYVVTAVTITAGVYYLVFHLSAGAWSLTRFVSWITYYSGENGFSFNVWNNLIYTLRSQVRTTFGGRVAFVREFGGPAMTILAALTTLAWLTFLVVLLRRWKEWRDIAVAAFKFSKRFAPLTILCALWIVPYVVFLFFFIPQNVFYRLFYLPAIILMPGSVLSAIQSSPNYVRRYRAAMFAIAVFLANLTFSQYPYTQVRANPPLALALRLNHVWPTGTVVYFTSPNTDASLVRYFNPGSVWVQITSGELTRQLDQLPRTPRGAWLETTLVDQLEATPEGKAWLERHAILRSDCELVNQKFRIRFYQLKPA